MIGETLNGQYRIVRQLGVGGMGAVYQAEDLASGQHVAIKVISTGDIAKDKALIGRFHREAKAAGGMDTDHIVRVLATGTDPTSGLPFMVMEYLIGEDLAQLFRRLGGALAPDLALRIVAQACVGLLKAHESNVIHRDIKPANIFIAERPGGGRIVKILDFGIAKIRQDKAASTETTGLTRTGSMIGSPLYMSPEQARGSKLIDHRADLWSLGIVLYQALTGRTPNHDIDALGELIIAICSELPRPVQELAPWVHPDVAAVVHEVLRFDPAERYQDAGAMLADLRRLLPEGSDLREEMLVPLSPDNRTVVAPRLSIRPLSMTPSRILGGRNDPEYTAATIPALTPPGFAGPGTPPLSVREGPTSSGLAGAPSSQQASSSRASLIIAAAVIAGVVIGIGAYKLTGLNRLDPAPAVAATGAPASAPTPAPVPPRPAPAAKPSAQVDPNVKSVRVAVGPADVSVEIDGKAAALTDGAVEIRDTLGSVHRVRVFRGTVQTTADVVVTEDGAMPSKIDLGVPKLGKVGLLPKPAGSP